ncbi:MAG: winged helix-turn-helix transcriptional regulator [Bacteroidales bacterium]|nr:winged helix-turn-helix transcriptional regulator [Bacteroidales bacterium]HPD95022.1 metalloregulator ArsR/SmtB family transcription factor [Tenuifilaceae bacterium]HRX32327.1 metalloregulator ArsR/SmtB family transcription factor [Tenuifilaceae bacterium]
MEKSKYTDEQIKLARYAKALSHPVRVQIMEILARQSCCYSGDMVDELPIARSTLSQHLTELRNAGLIQGEFNPPKIKYCINQEAWKEAAKLLTTFLAKKTTL